MVTEFIIVFSGYELYKYISHWDLHKLKRIFTDIMLKKGIKNKADETFEIYKINKTKYGYWGIIKSPNGLAFNDLNSVKSMLQQNLKCLLDFETERNSNLIKTKFVYNQLNIKDFKPVKTKSYELFLGYLLDGKPYKLDLNKDPQILISGKTGTGKSFLFASILTNIIYNNSKDIDIYLFQVMKGEIDVFRNCNNVKFVSDDAEEILIILEKLYKKIHERSKLFTQYGIKNITSWNKHFPNRKMKRLIIGVEEISFFSTPSDTKDTNEANPYFKYFIGIVKAGRSAGVHFISLTQRTTATNLGGNGELKSQMCVITGQQKTEKDSINAIDIEDAVSLRQQEYIANSSQGYEWFMSPTIDEDYNILQQYVPEIITPTTKKKTGGKRKHIDPTGTTVKCECYPLDDYKKDNQNKEEKSPKSISKRKGVISLDKLNELKKKGDNNADKNR